MSQLKLVQAAPLSLKQLPMQYRPRVVLGGVTGQGWSRRSPEWNSGPVVGHIAPCQPDFSRARHSVYNAADALLEFEATSPARRMRPRVDLLGPCFQ